MKVIHGFDSLSHLHNAVVTVGSYDGVHCGHRILIDSVVRLARECGGESVVATFEPHPRITLHDDEGLRLLTTLDEKEYLLGQCGVDYVVVIPFDEAFSRLSREEFLDDYIIGMLHAHTLVVGYNHRFGRNNEGDYSFLSRSAGIRVIEVGQQLVGAQKVSSTLVRNAIARGDVAVAVQLLGHPYIIMGKTDAAGVIEVDRYKLLPPAGNYRARVNGNDGIVEIDNGAVRILAGRTVSESYILEIYDIA